MKAISTYQLHHKKLGFYQGMIEGKLYWYPFSLSPELGIYRFSSRNDAIVTQNQLQKHLEKWGYVDKIQVQKFDEEENTRLLQLGRTMAEYLRVIPPGIA